MPKIHVFMVNFMRPETHHDWGRSLRENEINTCVFVTGLEKNNKGDNGWFQQDLWL
jgi:hypothetical protein